MDSGTHFGDMGLFQDGACPPPSTPLAIRSTLAPPPFALAPPPPPMAPPLPPPPPPLLPPPLIPGLGAPLTGLRRNKSVRKLFWKTIPEHQVKGRQNLWTQGPVEQHHIDAHIIEELFGHNNCQSISKTPPTRGGTCRTSFRESKEEVCILDGKRGMNIGIFLKQFKRSNEALVDDIRSGKCERFGPEALKELLKLLPDSEQMKKLKAFRGDVSKLSLADSFVYLLIQLPSFLVRIESMLLKEEFPAECESMNRDIRTLRSAIKELTCCEELHAVLHLVLQAGNLLNAGGCCGNAVGFKLSSLPSLAETRANRPGMNLMHFVAREAEKQDEKLLDFPLKLTHVQAASRICVEALDSELQRLVSRTHCLEENVQRDTELVQQLDSFLQSASSALCGLRDARRRLKAESDELLHFFCEDKETFKLDDCFSIFTSFCRKFTAAVKDNADRERKEASRQRRLQELEEQQKRHSWAAGEQFGGAFGLRSSTELDVNSALSRNDEAGLLMELLMPKSHPRSPLLRRSGSSRRSRNPAETDVGAPEVKHTDSSRSLGVSNEKTAPQNALNMTEYLRNNAKQTTSDLNNNGKETCIDQDELQKYQNSGCNATNMSVIVEKCKLVPELKAFDKVSTRSRPQNHVVLLDREEPATETVKENVDSLVKREEGGDTVIVWCVTGVCEVENDAQTFTETNPANHAVPHQQSANQATVPISSQPMPSTPLVSITSFALEAEKEIEIVQNLSNSNQNEGNEEESTNQERAVKSNVFQNGQEKVSTNRIRGSPCTPLKVEVVGQKMDEIIMETLQDSIVDQNNELSTNGNSKSQSSGLEVRNKQNCGDILEKDQGSETCQNTKTEQARRPKTSPGDKTIGTSTSSESDNIRRVVPISRPSSAKAAPPGSQRGAPSSSVPSRRERASTAPSSRRSSFNKSDHELELNKKTEAKKMQKKQQQEEKICRSALRWMNQKEERVWSAPATPTPMPGFAKNTASSSFRKTKKPTTNNVASSSPKNSPGVLSKSSQKSPGQTSPQRQSDVNTTSKASTLKRSSSKASSTSNESDEKVRSNVSSRKMSSPSDVSSQKSERASSNHFTSKMLFPSKNEHDSSRKSPKDQINVSNRDADQTKAFSNTQVSPRADESLSLNTTQRTQRQNSDSHRCQKSKHLVKSPQMSPSFLSNSSSSGKPLYSTPKASSSKAAPRSVTSLSKKSPNRGSNFPPSPSPSPLTSSSAKNAHDTAAPGSPLLNAAPGGRRRNDSGTVWDKSTVWTNASRPSWR